MKIADGLELTKSLGREKARLEGLANHDAWDYRSQDPNAKWMSNFNLEENHKKVMELDRLARKLSRAINATNNTQDILGIKEGDYAEYL
jgi:hypothetical protein